jgi:O-methyltransferase involved in polyketide biosynthesis
MPHLVPPRPAASLLEELQQHSFDAAQAVCYTWTGASMHLPADEVMRILSEMAGCAPGSSVVFDYCVHRRHLSHAGREELDALATQGEPLCSSFEPQLLEHMLRHHGFRQVEHLGPDEPGTRYGPRPSGIFRLIRATV